MSKRTIMELAKLNGRVYLYFANGKIKEQFLKDAEAEGIGFGDGASIRERELDSVMALNKNGTVNFLGFVGRMAYQMASDVGGQKLLRVDYGKYAAGKSDYIIAKEG